MSSELLALEIGNSRTKLLKRLNDAKSVLLSEYRVLFEDTTFNFQAKRLESACGRYRLQWTLRDRPDLPESYENQQTSRGCVFLIEVLSEDQFIGDLMSLTEELQART